MDLAGEGGGGAISVWTILRRNHSPSSQRESLLISPPTAMLWAAFRAQRVFAGQDASCVPEPRRVLSAAAAAAAAAALAVMGAVGSRRPPALPRWTRTAGLKEKKSTFSWAAARERMDQHGDVA